MVLEAQGSQRTRKGLASCLDTAYEQYGHGYWKGKVGRSYSNSSQVVSTEGFGKEILSWLPAPTAHEQEE